MKTQGNQSSIDKPEVAAVSDGIDSRSLTDLCKEFVCIKRAAGCSKRTLEVYEFWLGRLETQVGDHASTLDTPALARFLAGLRERGLSDSTVNQAYRNLGTFTRWLEAMGVLDRNPMVDIRVKTPITLPYVFSEDEIRAVLACCSASFEGVRNRTWILVELDAGLRASETTHVLIRDWNSVELCITVRSGKGRKDRVTFVSPTTAEAIRQHLEMRPGVCAADPLFADAAGRPLTTRHLVQILHRLSARAGLPPHRRLHPHACRRWAATNWIRAGMGLDQVRRLLGHGTLSTTLRYVSLVSADLQRAHRDADVIDRLRVLPNWNSATRARATGERTSPSIAYRSSITKTRRE